MVGGQQGRRQRKDLVLGDWAYCQNYLAVVMTPGKGGTPVKRAGNVLSILHKQFGNWVIARDADGSFAVRDAAHVPLPKSSERAALER
jgi:ketosteroid isomerase-like protein